jgi:pimeloyl-ACP methyl ester carboxylesterase
MNEEERASVAMTIMDTRFTPEWLEAHPADKLFVQGIRGDYGATPGSEAERGEIEQLAARRTHDVWERLGAISAPTFVGAGRFDGIAPLSNSEAIAQRIPNAELHVYEGGHGFFAQDASAFPEIIAFLSS